MSNHSAENMGQVLPFRRQNAFLPDATRTIGEAYDSAIATLQADAQSELCIRELVAKRIIHAAYIGEVDGERLRQSGLSGRGRLRYRL